jgi:hypothetical protein
MLSIFRQKFSLREGAPQPPFEVVTLLCALVAEDTLLPFLRYMQALHGSICTTTATAADETTVTQPGLSFTGLPAKHWRPRLCSSKVFSRSMTKSKITDSQQRGQSTPGNTLPVCHVHFSCCIFS